MFILISLIGAGVNYLKKKRGDEEKTEDHTETQDTEDPVPTDSLPDPGLECEDETQTDSAVPQESVNEAEGKSQKVEESGSLLDDERSILEERVRELEELLCEREREYERKQEVTLAESEHVKSWLDYQMVSLQKLTQLLFQKHTECTKTKWLYEEELNFRKRLQSKYEQKGEQFIKQTKYLRVALDEAEKKCDQARVSNAQQEMIKSRLWSDLSLMHDAMQDLDEGLSLKCTYYKEMKTKCEKEPHSHQMTSTHHEELLQGILAKAKELHGEMTGIHNRLKREEEGLKNEVNKLQTFTQQLKIELSESHKTFEEMKTKREKDKEHNIVLKCDQMTSTDLMESAQVSQPGDEEESEYITQLENEISDLESQVMTLQDSLQGLSILLTGTNRKCEMESENYRITFGIHQFVETQAKKRERFLIRKIEIVKKSLKDLQTIYKEEENRIIELEENIDDILIKLNIISDEFDSVSNELNETKRTLGERTQELQKTTRQLTQAEPKWKYLKEMLIKDRDDKLRAHELLKVQYSEINQQHYKLKEDDVRLRQAYSTLESQYEELKQQHGSQMECKCKQEQEQESSTHTEESGSVNRQQGSVQQLEEELTAKRRKYDEMEREMKVEQEQHDLLKARCQQLEESLQECQELLKIRSPDL